ncbi:MAG: hypothetical protein E7587_00370 [Ruminococcaceae bacterium]|nr:hypothetical protein [Oscillospiraceae bacterium]
MKYILYKDGSGICKTREGITLDTLISITFTGDVSALRMSVSSNGSERFFSIVNSVATLSKNAFSEGINKITVYGKSKRWKCEALSLKDNILTPCGCDSTEEIALFKSEYERLSKRLSACENQLSELSKAIKGSKLFK